MLGARRGAASRGEGSRTRASRGNTGTGSHRLSSRIASPSAERRLTCSPALAEWLCCFLWPSAPVLPPELLPPDDFPLPPGILTDVSRRVRVGGFEFAMQGARSEDVDDRDALGRWRAVMLVGCLGSVELGGWWCGNSRNLASRWLQCCCLSGRSWSSCAGTTGVGWRATTTESTHHHCTAGLSPLSPPSSSAPAACFRPQALLAAPVPGKEAFVDISRAGKTPCRPERGSPEPAPAVGIDPRRNSCGIDERARRRVSSRVGGGRASSRSSEADAEESH